MGANLEMCPGMWLGWDTALGFTMTGRTVTRSPRPKCSQLIILKEKENLKFQQKHPRGNLSCSGKSHLLISKIPLWPLGLSTAVSRNCPRGGWTWGTSSKCSYLKLCFMTSLAQSVKDSATSVRNIQCRISQKSELGGCKRELNWNLWKWTERDKWKSPNRAVLFPSQQIKFSRCQRIHKEEKISKRAMKIYSRSRNRHLKDEKKECHSENDIFQYPKENSRNIWRDEKNLNRFSFSELEP